MPPATNEKKAAATKLSPYDAFQATVDAELKEAGCTGYMLVRGVPEGDSEDEGEDEDEERDDATFTAEDVAHVRVVFATARREKAHKTATKLVLGDQYPDSDDEGGGFMTMFNTSFSYEVGVHDHQRGAPALASWATATRGHVPLASVRVHDRQRGAQL